MLNLAIKKCIPCEAGTPPFTRAEAGEYLALVSGWELVDPISPKASRGEGLKIRKRFKFTSYMQGIKFVNELAKIAEAENHHPDLFVGFQKVTVNLTTHVIGGLSENDFILAAKINQILK